MDLWQLFIFVSVVEHKSFSRASEAIHLSQPTVSSHIKELEEYFNCRLLDRLGKTTEPTRAGRLLYQYAKDLLRLKDQAESAIHDFVGKAKGDLFIGGSTIPSGFILPSLIGPFSRQFPDIMVHLTTGDTMQIVSKIEDGSLEWGVVGARVENPHLIQEEWVTDEMKLIVPAGHPLAKEKEIEPSQLFKLPFIAREKGSGTWKSIHRSLLSAGLDPADLSTRMTLGSTTSVIQAILNQAGVSILSTIAVQDDLDSGRLAARPVSGLDLNRFFYLTRSKRRSISPVSQKFIEFARTML